MDSVDAGLRAGDLTRDAFDRLHCSACAAPVARRVDPDGAADRVVECPDCGRGWRDFG